MDPFLIPIQILVIGIYFFRWKIINKIPEPTKIILTEHVKEMHLILGKWWKTILLPILFIFGCFSIWVIIYIKIYNQSPHFPLEDSLLLYIVESGLLAPISEQILQCFFISLVFLAVQKLYKNKWVVFGMNLIGLICISFLFAFEHFNPAPMNFVLRFSLFMIYGAFFYLYERNMLPSIIAHSSWNMMALIPTIL